MRGVWLAMCGMALAGCSQGLDNFNQFTDVRVLAMQASPPAVLSDTPAPLDTSFSALLVDPRGGPINYTWSFCPVQSSQACDDFEDQLALLSTADQNMLRGLRGITQAGTASPQLDSQGAPSYAVTAFDLVSTATAAGIDLTSLYGYYVKTNVLGEGLGVWPSAILEVHSPHGDGVVAQKRVVYGIQSFAVAAAPLAQRFGFVICPPSGTPPPGCLALPTFTPNHNPVFAQILSAPGSRVTYNYAPMPQPASLAAGQSMQIRPTFTPDSVETYPTLRGNLQSRELEVETITEALSVTWFCSQGTLAHGLTWPLFTKTLDNTYTAPAQPPSDTQGVVTCWLVARDQRGGEAWQSLQIQITP